MIDEIFDRSYQSGRSGLNSGIDRLLARIVTGASNAFEALERIQFAAPWSERRRHGPGCA